MKINRLEAHDRLQYFLKDQSETIFQGAEKCLKENPLSLKIQEKCPYLYIWAHPRTADDGVNKRLLWQPRLSIPDPQTNSYLFRAISNTDLIEVVWILPPRELWSQYSHGKVTESNWALWSIEQFTKNRKLMMNVHPDDLPQEITSKIMRTIVDEHRQELKNKSLIIKPEI